MSAATHNHPPAIREHGLQDGCIRCAEHARDLLSLDDDNLAALIERTRLWMRDEGDDCYPRSVTEDRAMRAVEKHLVFARTMERLDRLADGPANPPAWTRRGLEHASAPTSHGNERDTA